MRHRKRDMTVLLLFLGIQLMAQGNDGGYTNPVVRCYTPDPPA